MHISHSRFIRFLDGQPAVVPMPTRKSSVKRNTRRPSSETPAKKEYTVRGRTRTGKQHAVRIRKKVAHVVDQQLYPETVGTRQLLGEFQSPIVRVKGDEFVAEPRKGPANPSIAASKGMQRVQKRQINIGANSERQRNIDETMIVNERRARRHH